MKRRVFRPYLIIFLLPWFVLTCKKGEDDPFLSLKSRKKRLVGKWEVKSYLFETLDLMDPTTVVYYENFIMEFEKDGDYKESNDFFDENGTKTANNHQGIWDFENDKENLQVFYNSRMREYTIRKLSKDELVLAYFTNGYEVEIFAEKQ